MKGEGQEEQLREWARARGYRVAWGPSTVIASALADVEGRQRSGELDAAFARGNLSLLIDAAGNPDVLPVVLAIAVPRPAYLVTFLVAGGGFRAVIPPTYQRYRATFDEVRRDLERGALPGARVETLEIPAKNVASLLGLVRYGRNNVTYAPGMGSYLQLCVYSTNANLEIAPDWQEHEPALLDECESCGVCEAVCPTSAVDGERVLLRAERCLTLANESEGTWPPWVSPSAHHTLIGCLRCQRQCPANPELPVTDSGVVFDKAESAALLAGGRRIGRAWDGIRAKLEALGRQYDEPVIARNLRALLDAEHLRAAGRSVA